MQEAELLEWIRRSSGTSPADAAEVVSRACQTVSSPGVLTACILALPAIAKAGWNLWKMFPPQRTADKSAVRFIEQAIDKVALWPDSGPVWEAARACLLELGCEKDVVRKLYIRQLQAVPMPAAMAEAVKRDQIRFEEGCGLTHLEADTSRAESIWRSWSALENACVLDPSMFSEMIEKRKSVDPQEYVVSLYARSVIADPGSVDRWAAYSSYCSETLKNQKLKLSVLERAVKYCPSVGGLWVDLFQTASHTHPESVERIVRNAITALRDSAGCDGNGECMEILLLGDASLKLAAGDSGSAREAFQNAVAILSEISAKQGVVALVAWLHAETFHPTLSAEDGSLTLLGEFLSNPDWSERRTACTPLQWVQLAWLARGITSPGEDTDDLDFCRSIYQAATHAIEEKHKYIIFQDWLLFETAFGTPSSAAECRVSIDRLSSQTEKRKAQIRDDVDVKKPRTIRADERVSRSTAVVPRSNALPLDPVPVIPHAPAFPNCVYVRDLPFSVSEERLLEFFESDCGIGKPEKVLIVKNSEGRSRGFGYAEFASPEQATSAISLTGKSLEGRAVAIFASNRGITAKKPKHTRMDLSTSAPVSDETVVAKSNDYFRSLVAQKQKQR